jgi:Raf kinase inhibitor-like YbhB/YbcL family protein
MKKMMVTVLSALTVFTGYGFSYAEQPTEKDAIGNVASFMKWNSPYNISLQTTKENMKDQKVIRGRMINARYMIPFQETMAALGFTVSKKDSALMAQKANKLVLVQENKSTALINNRMVSLDLPNESYNKDLLVSLHVLVDLIPTADIDWDATTRTLSIKVTENNPTFKVNSLAVGTDHVIPDKYVHPSDPKQKDISLPLSWSGTPKEAKALAISIYDVHAIPDSFLHWGIININPTISQLKEGISKTIQIPSSSFEPAPYFGPAPPPGSGDHYYKVTVYALDTDRIKPYPISKFPSYKEDFVAPLKDHIIGQAVTTFYYKK